MAFNTGKPVGSTDPRDLYDNASNLDKLVNGPEPFYPDRLGKQRYSWAGIEYDFNEAQDGREVAFQEFLASSGYEPPVSYAAGVTLDRATQTFVRNDILYRIKAPSDLPYTLTGDWEEEDANFSVIGDAALRQELASSEGAGLVGLGDGTVSDLVSTADNKGISLIPRSAQIVSSIAQLRLLSKAAASKTALVTGYYAERDGGGGTYTLDEADTASVDNGGTVIVADDGGRWKLVYSSTLELRQFGARGDGATGDDSALAAWFAAVLALRVRGVINKGRYKLTQAATWDFASVAHEGCLIEGEGGPNDCILDFTAVTTTDPFSFIGSNGTAIFYLRFRNFAVRTNRAGVGFRIGKDDYTDAFNSCVFDLVINNGSIAANAVACRLNYICQSDIKLVVNGAGSGRPGASTAPGYGTALSIAHVVFSKLMLACGNAQYALKLESNYSYGNSFFGTDIEEVDTAILINSANASNNEFVSGTFVARVIFDCTAGAANRFTNCNISPYSGGTEIANSTGIIIDKGNRTGVSTPTLPASGAIYRNATGRRVVVYIGGGSVSAIQITKAYGTVSGLPGVTGALPHCVHLSANESITLTYSTAPSWVWFPDE